MAVQQSHASMAPISIELRNNNYQLSDEDTKKWISGKFKKIFLQTDDKSSMEKLEKKLTQQGIEYYPIYEEGLSGELNAIGLKPTKRSNVSKPLRSLNLSKDPKNENILLYIKKEYRKRV